MENRVCVLWCSTPCLVAIIELFNYFAYFERIAVISEAFGGRDSPDQIVPSKRPYSTFSLSSHSLISKDQSATPSSGSIDTPLLSPQLPTIREYDNRKLLPFSEVSLWHEYYQHAYRCDKSITCSNCSYRFAKAHGLLVLPSNWHH